MENKPRFRFNPFIVGQITLLLGGVALGLAVLSPVIITNGPQPSGIWEDDVKPDTATQQQLKPYRVASIGIAITGLCCGPIGWLRERPPVLPAFGMVMCTVALFWYWIVAGLMLAVTIIVLFLVITCYAS